MATVGLACRPAAALQTLDMAVTLWLQEQLRRALTTETACPASLPASAAIWQYTVIGWAVDESDEVISRIVFTGMGEELGDDKVSSERWPANLGPPAPVLLAGGRPVRTASQPHTCRFQPYPLALLAAAARLQYQPGRLDAGHSVRVCRQRHQ